MRKIITLLVFATLFISLVSADILIQQQPGKLYNIGDTIGIPVKITTLTGLQQTFHMYLICNNQQKEFYMNDVDLSAGEEQSFNAVLRLDKSKVGGLTGDCKIKAVLGGDYVLTNEFKISSFIKIDYPVDKVEFKPGESVIISGKATKESGQPATGFIELSIVSDTQNIDIKDTVNKGYFSVNFSIPKNMPAGQYLTKIKVYEKDESEETNSGFVDYNILVTQIPTNLEIVFDETQVEPGTSLRVKAVLHDQSGEKIASVAVITIKNMKNKILQQTEKPTDEFLEYSIKYNEPPAEWKIFAVSNQLTSESTFKIKEKQDVKVEIINKTLIVTNIGNVPYNNTLLVKIGEEIVNIDVILEVDESQEYVLSAPDGQYNIEVTSKEGNKISESSVMLTGKSIDVEKAAEGVAKLARHPLVWIFIIAILGFVAFIIYRKGYQRSFIGYITKKKDKPQQLAEKTMVKDLVNPKNKAELSLSIKGDKQDVSLACIHIKNLKEIGSQKTSAKETLQKIINLAYENKATVYENQDDLFFILAPVTTRTFKNEKTALKIAQRIENILIEHNKLAKQKIDFGISLNYGAIVAKKEGDILKFMSMGTLITGAKKIASIADREILLGEKIKERLMTDVKTEKQIRNNVAVYAIKEIKGEPREDHQRFIDGFLRRLGKED